VAVSTCDACAVPGRCCSGFNLNFHDGQPDTAADLLVRLARVYTSDCEGRPVVGLPFLPLWKDSRGTWRMWCPLLTAEGRCGEHAHRPGLCASFEPGTEALCVMQCPAAPALYEHIRSSPCPLPC
jgi:Fe-S-cluster containining protein